MRKFWEFHNNLYKIIVLHAFNSVDRETLAFIYRIEDVYNYRI